MPNSQVVALQLEKVRDKIPLLYERDDMLLTMIQQRGDIEKVSTRFMRLPLQIIPGGKAATFNPDGGDLGRGTMTTYDYAQVTPIWFRFAVELTKLVEWATNAKDKAVEDASKREVANGMKQFRAFLDKLIQTTGNGQLGTINSVSGTVLTMAVPNGAALVYMGQTIQIWDTTGTILRGTTNVVQCDPVNNQTITVDVLPAGTVATDIIVHDGLGGSITNQSSLFGIKYHQSNATTGTWLNLNRATYAAQLQTPRVNGQNSALVPQYVRLAVQKIRKSLGSNAVGKLLAYMGLEQEAAWENIGTTISQVILNQLKEGQPDALPGVPKTMGGFPLKSSINADQTRIDFLDMTHWGRAIMQDIDFFDVNGQTMFQIYGASGGVSAAYDFYYVTGFQVWNDSPRNGAFIDSLARPTGF